MNRDKLSVMIGIVFIVSLALVPGGALAQPEECTNADRGPDDGPPGFVAGLVPDFVGDLVGSLPVPNFVKSFFGAPTC